MASPVEKSDSDVIAAMLRFSDSLFSALLAESFAKAGGKLQSFEIPPHRENIRNGIASALKPAREACLLPFISVWQRFQPYVEAAADPFAATRFGLPENRDQGRTSVAAAIPGIAGARSYHRPADRRSALPGALRPRQAGYTDRAHLRRAGQRGIGEEAVRVNLSCPGRGASFFTVHRRAGTPYATWPRGPPDQQRTTPQARRDCAASGARVLLFLVHRLALFDERRQPFGASSSAKSREQITLDMDPSDSGVSKARF